MATRKRKKYCPHGYKRNRWIALKVDEVELVEIKKQAFELDMDVSEFIRFKCLESNRG